MRYNSIFSLLCMVWLVLPAHAKPLVADIAPRVIKIDSTFAGMDVLLFGARHDAGDVVVVVRGPTNPYVVRKKERLAGIWVNKNQVMFENIHGFYALASSRPLEEIKNEYLLTSLGIGIENLEFTVTNDVPWDMTEEFSEALLRSHINDALYTAKVKEVSFMGETLFRTLIHFPERIPRGDYTVETYLLGGGELLGVQFTPVRVEQVGFDAFLFRLAYRYAHLYGLLAVIIALFAGWLASILFRKI